MSDKSPISLTDQQEAFARSPAETVQTKALGELLEHRLKGPVVSTTEMGKRIGAMIERKRLTLLNQ